MFTSLTRYADDILKVIYNLYVKKFGGKSHKLCRKTTEYQKNKICLVLRI